MKKSTTAQAANARDPKEVAEQLGALLQGELSAIETYRMAIEKMKSDPRSAGRTQRLHTLQRQHVRAADLLREHIGALGGQVPESSGLWGTWARLVQGAADLLGEGAALKSLKEGEESGRNDYQKSLGKLDGTSLELVRQKLLPAQKQHVRALDELMSARKN
jgi:hypothetical protein